MRGKRREFDGSSGCGRWERRRIDQNSLRGMFRALEALVPGLWEESTMGATSLWARRTRTGKCTLPVWGGPQMATDDATREHEERKDATTKHQAPPAATKPHRNDQQ